MQDTLLTPYIHLPIDKAIYLGAGHGHELPYLLALEPKQILLVEGDEEQAEQLEAQISAYPQVQIVKRLLAPTTETRIFYRYSLSDLNSLSRGEGVQQLYPNVRLLEEKTYQTEAVAEWLQSLELTEKRNLLWIDLPGQEEITLLALAQSGCLDYFDHLILYGNTEPCYENQATLEVLRHQLNDLGYSLQYQNSDIDPDRPLLVLSRHALYWSNKRLANEKEQLFARGKELEALLQAQKVDLSDKTKKIEAASELTKAQSENISVLEVKLAEAKQAEQAQAEKLQQLEKQLTDSQKSAKTKQEKVASLEIQLAEAQKAANTDKENFNTLKTDLETQFKEKQSLIEKVKAAELKLSESVKSDESKQVAISKLQSELAEAKQAEQAQAEKLQQLEKQLTDSQKSAKTKQEMITALEAKYAVLEEEKNKIHNYFVNRKKQAEEGEEKIKALTETNSRLEQTQKTLQIEKESLVKDLEATKANLSSTQQALTQAQATIEALQNNSNQLQKLEETMATLFSKQGQTMQEYTNALGQHVTRTAKSTTQNIESFLGMQKYLVQDGTPLQLNGSRLSAELALKLTERLHHTHYDLIIEFGTGTSTQLLAKALLKQERDKPHSQHLITHNATDAYSAELPKRIISFEHNKKALASLSQQLEQQNLASLVELIFAPLTEFTHKGEDYLFYECKSKLKQLAQVFEHREAKILVLVDGPDTPDESLSRYPLLPLLLKHLATHQLDIVVMQSHKHLPDELMAAWQTLLNKRYLAFETQPLTHEKDAILLNINGE